MKLLCFVSLALLVSFAEARAQEGWKNIDLGSPAISGGAEWLNDGTLKLKGSGAVAGGAFSLHHAYLSSQELTGVSEFSTNIKLDSAAGVAGLFITFGEEGSLFAGRYGLKAVRTIASNGEIVEFDIDPDKPVLLKMVWDSAAGTILLSDDAETWEELTTVSFRNAGLTTVGVGTSSTNGNLKEAVFADLKLNGLPLAEFEAHVQTTGTMSREAKKGSSGTSLQRGQEYGPDIVESTGGAGIAIPPPAPPDGSGSQSGFKCIYVDGANGNDARDGRAATKGSGAAGPKRTLQAAMAVAQDGDKIVITAGTYNPADIFAQEGGPAVIIEPVGSVVF